MIPQPETARPVISPPPHTPNLSTLPGSGSIEEICTTLAGVVNIDDFLEDLDAAERTLRLYLTT
jgi:hypothetical protein